MDVRLPKALRIRMLTGALLLIGSGGASGQGLAATPEERVVPPDIQRKLAHAAGIVVRCRPLALGGGNQRD